MNISYREALAAAIHQEMEKDSSVIVMGLDVDDHKAIYGSLQGITDKFGPERIFCTPLSEEGATGFAVGAALAGKKVVHVHIRADFGLLAFNQLINMASNIHYLSQGALSVPLTVRCVIGRGWGQGAQHSKSLHSMLAHIPGLKVYAPARPQEAFSCLRQSVQDPNPCIILEHRWLYDVSGSLDKNLSFSGETILQEGKDITIVATSWMSVEALSAAQALQARGVSCEVIDLSQIAPLKLDQVMASVQKTGRLLVGDCDWPEFGLASEIVARVTEEKFSALKMPPRRLGYAPIPCPTARAQEVQFYPSTQDIVTAVTNMLKLDSFGLEQGAIHSYERRFKGPF